MKYDVIVVSDHGHGVFTNLVRKTIQKYSNKLFLNTQINSFNRGYHTLFKYKNLNTLVINESELRYELRDKKSESKFLAKEISKKIHEQGIKSLEIPVMGGPNVAIDGKLVLMASGNKAIYEKYIKIFETIATETFFLGESGSAHGIKLAMNLQISLLALSLSEGITLTKKAGFDPEKFLEILNSTYFSTGMSQKKAYKMIKDEYQPTFTLKNMKKDLDIITQAAKDFGAILPMAERANKIYSDALEAGLGEIDYTGILAHIQKNSDD